MIRWDGARVDQLTLMWNRGDDVKVIADALGCKPHSVLEARKRFGLVPRFRRPSRCKKPKQYVSPFRGISPKEKVAPPLPCPDAPGWPTKQQLMAGR